MGVCASKTIEQQRNKEIDQEIAKDKQLKVQKLLLLGAGECGKSTILKQMRLLHNEFTENDKLFYKPLIFSHTIISMAALAESMSLFELSFEDTQREFDVQMLKKIISDEEDQNPIEPELSDAIKRLWNDEAIKKCFTHKDEIHVSNSAKYFFDEIDRISENNYVPTTQDILNVRSATIGIQEVRFWHKETQLRIFDVGGQKSQRKKWIHVFDDVNAVIFITAISEFNQVMREDSNTNRLLDSLTLFADISNNKYFVKSSMIVFMNKKDLFQEKLNQKLSLKCAFSDYEGPDDYESSVQFIKTTFSDSVEDKEKKLYFHETCANDTDQVQKVLKSVTDIILAQVANQTGL